MAISVTVTSAKIDVTATDVGGNTIDDIYVAVAASAFPALMVRTGTGPYVYTLPAQTELEISANCWIKDYTAGGGTLEWGSRTANSTAILDNANGGKLELGPDWTIDFCSVGTYYTYVYGYGQFIFQGTEGHPVTLKHQYHIYVYLYRADASWDWDWVSLEDMNYGNGYWLYFVSNSNYYKPKHSFRNITFSNPSGGVHAARGYIYISGTLDMSEIEFDRLTFDGVYHAFRCNGGTFKVTNSTIKNTTSNPIDITGAGNGKLRFKIGSETEKDVFLDQQPKIVFDTCVFQDNYGTNEYIAGLIYGSIVKFKNCTLEELGSPPGRYGFMSYSNSACLYEGVQTVDSISNKYYHGSGGGSHFDCKTLMLNVTDSGGSPVEGATVTISEVNGNHTETLRTRATGYIKDLFGDDIVLPYREITNNTYTTFTNWGDYIITVSHPDYQIDTRQISMTDDQNITVALADMTPGNTRIYGSTLIGSTVY